MIATDDPMKFVLDPRLVGEQATSADEQRHPGYPPDDVVDQEPR